jgi:hypothetical protein
MTPRWFPRIAGLTCFLVLLVASPADAQYATDTVKAIASSGGPLYLTPFRPPVEYRRWYHAMEWCLRLKGDYEAVTWFVVPEPWSDGRAPGHTHGFWRAPHKIVLNALEWRDSVLVSHEAAHDILGSNGLQAVPHPQPYFNGHCADSLYPGKAGI